MTPNPSERPDFAELYDQHFSRVYNYVRYRVPDAATADDVVSRSFERALDRFESFDPARGAAASWLIGIASNAVADHYRNRRRLSWLPLDLLAGAAGSDPRAEDELARRESDDELHAALERLDERDREILGLKYGARLMNTDIAAQLGLSESNVGVIVHRALKRLEAALELGR